MAGTIGITIGDPAGIGPEIIDGALKSNDLPAGYEFRVIGENTDSIVAGDPSPESARIALEALEEGSRLAMEGEIDALVTAPVSKIQLQWIGFNYPGQTEFFADRTGTTNYAMLLTGGRLTVALVTIHIPLRDVPEKLSGAEIVRVGGLLVDFLRMRVPDRTPRVAVTGLNPHAGETGTLGREEGSIISPAVHELQKLHAGQAIVDGPFAADSIFHHAAEGEWDAVLCMYHDQGLIPLKLQAFHSGVNTTLGLPIIRTSPDHGTAFDIAGRGIARPDSMIAAIRLAAELITAKKANSLF